MTSLPPEPDPDPPERKPNRRRAVDNGLESESKRQRDLPKPWVKLEPGELHRRVYGGAAFTRAQAARQRKGRP